MRDLPDDQVAARWADELADEADDARLTDWNSRILCAETNTLAAGSGVTRLRDLTAQGHRVVLAASDTGDGVAAALCAAQHIAGPDLAGVTYLSTPETLGAAPLGAESIREAVTVVRLRGLDPRHLSGRFITAVAGMGLVLRAALDTGEKIEVHLTGGFKATLLHALAMTEILYSLKPDRVTAHYVYEDAGPAATAQAIGLRRFSQSYVDDMRAELTKVRDGGRQLGAETFEGMAWTSEDGLNAFGYGYLAVLGEPLSAGRPGDAG